MCIYISCTSECCDFSYECLNQLNHIATYRFDSIDTLIQYAFARYHCYYLLAPISVGLDRLQLWSEIERVFKQTIEQLNNNSLTTLRCIFWLSQLCVCYEDMTDHAIIDQIKQWLHHDHINRSLEHDDDESCWFRQLIDQNITSLSISKH
jgi:hypothetical protein